MVSLTASPIPRLQSWNGGQAHRGDVTREPVEEAKTLGSQFFAFWSLPSCSESHGASSDWLALILVSTDASLCHILHSAPNSDSPLLVPPMEFTWPCHSWYHDQTPGLISVSILCGD